MTAPSPREAVIAALAMHGHRIPDAAHDTDLLMLGVNSAALIEALSAVEDRFDVELDVAELFRAPITVDALAAAITSCREPG